MYKFIKRTFDILASFIGLLIAAIPMLIVAVLIKIDSQGPVLFKQKRIGLGGKEFYIYKFRSMVVNAEKSGVYSDDKDSRLTRVGKILRKTSIDEIPQFINILKGEMSFIGPRPLLADFDKRFEGWERKKYQVKPGLSGLAQIKGGAYLSIKGRSLYDVYYAENLSLSLDCKIFFKTFAVLLKGEKRCIQEPEEGKIKP